MPDGSFHVGMNRHFAPLLRTEHQDQETKYGFVHYAVLPSKPFDSTRIRRLEETPSIASGTLFLACGRTRVARGGSHEPVRIVTTQGRKHENIHDGSDE